MHATGRALGKEVAFEFRDMPEAIRPKYQYFTEANMQKLPSAGYTRGFHSLVEGVVDYVARFLSGEDAYR